MCGHGAQHNVRSNVSKRGFWPTSSALLPYRNYWGLLERDLAAKATHCRPVYPHL